MFKLEFWIFLTGFKRKILRNFILNFNGGFKKFILEYFQINTQVFNPTTNNSQHNPKSSHFRSLSESYFSSLVVSRFPLSPPCLSLLALWSWIEKTLTIANKHHNIGSSKTTKDEKVFLPAIFSSSRLKKLLDAMENHFAMSTSERGKSFSFISFWLLTIYLLSILLVNLKLRFHFSL